MDGQRHWRRENYVAGNRQTFTCGLSRAFSSVCDSLLANINLQNEFLAKDWHVRVRQHDWICWNRWRFGDRLSLSGTVLFLHSNSLRDLNIFYESHWILWQFLMELGHEIIFYLILLQFLIFSVFSSISITKHKSAAQQIPHQDNIKELFWRLLSIA